MKTNGKHEVMARIARQSLVFAALVAMVLATAGISGAQASTTSPAQPAAKARTSPAAKSPARGSDEGVKVHGHWTMAIRNPDGGLVRRVEFENALVPLGSSVIASLLTGAYSSGPVWQVLLNGTGGFGVCCTLDSPSFCTASSPCSVGTTNNLTQALTNSSTSLTLMGSMTVPVAGEITNVSTYIAPCTSAVAPQSCIWGPTSQGPFVFTNANLDGNTVPGDPFPVSVGANQTIEVTVTFSFQ